MKTSEDRHYGKILRVCFLCLVWYSVSASANVVGKLFLRDFPYPTTRTIVHLLATVVFLIPTLRLLDIPKPQPFTNRYYAKLIIPLAIGKFIALALSHVSIWKVPVSYAHTIKATMPLFVVVLSRVILRERQTTQVYLSLLPIIAGVFIATVTELSFDLIGLLSALLSTCLFSLQNIFSKKVLKEFDIHHLRLLQVLAQLALCLFIPFWVLFDGVQLLNAATFSDVSLRVVALAATDGFLAFAQNLVAFTMLSLVSPVSYSVANASKRIFVIAVSIMLLRNPVSLANAAGMSIAVMGVFFYNKAKFDQRAQKQVATVLPFKVKEASLLTGLGQSGMNGGRELSNSFSDDSFPIVIVPAEATNSNPPPNLSPATKSGKTWLVPAPEERTWA